MPSQINQAQQAPESALDKLLKVISIANQGVGAAAGVQDFRLKGAQATQANNLLANKFTTADLASKALKKGDPSLVGGPAPQPLSLGSGPLSPEFAQSTEYKASPEFAAYQDEAGPLVKLTPLPGKTMNSSGDWVDTPLTSDTEEKEKLDRLDKLKAQYGSDKTTERSAAMVEAFAGLQQLKDHPGSLGPADMGSLVKYIQTLDPSGGALRGGKLDTADKSVGYAAWAENLVNKMLTGKLGDKERQEFFDAAKNLVTGQLGLQQKIDDQAKSDALAQGLRYHSVLNPLFSSMNAQLNSMKDAPKASLPKPTEVSDEDWSKATASEKSLLYKHFKK